MNYSHMETDALEDILDELTLDIQDREDAYKERQLFYNSILATIEKLKDDVDEKVNTDLGGLLDDIHSMNFMLDSVKAELAERRKENEF